MILGVYMQRRDVIKGSIATFLSLTTVSFADTKSKNEKVEKLKNISENPRIIVVGGGWAGLSFAKHIKINVPNSEVTLVERRDSFFSGPASNSWLFGLVDQEFLTHSYLDAAKNHNYKFLQASAIGLESKSNILRLKKERKPF